MGPFWSDSDPKGYTSDPTVEVVGPTAQIEILNICLENGRYRPCSNESFIECDPRLLVECSSNEWSTVYWFGSMDLVKEEIKKRITGVIS